MCHNYIVCFDLALSLVNSTTFGLTQLEATALNSPNMLSRKAVRTIVMGFCQLSPDMSSFYYLIYDIPQRLINDHQ